jgi:omega-6 fatty acid desaturase (delta-12 desaturase)
MSTLYRPEEGHLILASDIGLGITLAGVYYASTIVGWPMTLLLWLQPYLWLNHWIVAVTYLHHTHPDVPKYEPEAWTFLKGATATIDRGLGFGGKHFMHNIADFHVVHHLFSKIPQYHAEEATRAIQPLLKDSYHEDKQRSFWGCIYESFTKCQYVVASDPDAAPKDRVMIYKGGPAPPIEWKMGRGGLKHKDNMS